MAAVQRRCRRCCKPITNGEGEYHPSCARRETLRRQGWKSGPHPCPVPLAHHSPKMSRSEIAQKAGRARWKARRLDASPSIIMKVIHDRPGLKPDPEIAALVIQEELIPEPVLTSEDCMANLRAECRSRQTKAKPRGGRMKQALSDRSGSTAGLVSVELKRTPQEWAAVISEARRKMYGFSALSFD